MSRADLRHVQRREPAAKLAPSPVAEAQFVEARKRHRKAQARYDRAIAAHARGAIGEAELGDARAELAQAAARLSVWRGRALPRRSP